jgi:hypothetical protein
MGWGEHSDGHDRSFGLGALWGANRYRLPLGSFGEAVSWRLSRHFLDPSCRDTHWVRLVTRRWLRLGNPIGFVWEERLAPFDDIFRNPTYQNQYWLRLGNSLREECCPPSRPIMPRYPLGSSENRGRHDCNHASSAPPRPRPFSWGGVSIPMVMTVRLARERRGWSIVRVGFSGGRGSGRAFWHGSAGASRSRTEREPR